MDADVAPVAQALSKAWIYEQEPGLTSYAEGDIAKLGNQSRSSLPEGEAVRAKAVLDILAGLKKRTLPFRLKLKTER